MEVVEVLERASNHNYPRVTLESPYDMLRALRQLRYLCRKVTSFLIGERPGIGSHKGESRPWSGYELISMCC